MVFLVKLCQMQRHKLTSWHHLILQLCWYNVNCVIWIVILFLMSSLWQFWGPFTLSVNNRFRASASRLTSLPSATMLRRLCFYRCLSVHRGGCLVWGGAWYPGVPGPRGMPGPGGGLVSQHALRQTPPGETATAADGTHPTGMHSCLWSIGVASHFWSDSLGLLRNLSNLVGAVSLATSQHWRSRSL